MLGHAEGLLDAELEAQAQALPVYLDERLFITCYEREVARLVRDELWGNARGPVLDAGCGIGLFGRLWPELELYGLDASSELLEQAGPGYVVRVEGDVTALPFPDGSLGAVLAINMLHHVIHPELAMREFARVLRAGGTLIAVDPRRVAPVELAKRLLRRGDPAYAATHRAFAPGEYRALLGTDGAFTVEDFREVGLAPLLLGGGLDALGISHLMPSPQATQAAVDALCRLDALLAALPGLGHAGLNLCARARRR
jgi:SAM-dependent methyltransferase